MTAFTASSLNVPLLSSAARFRQKFAQLGESLAPKMWLVIWNSEGLSRSLSSHQRNLNASESSGGTFTWLNMPSMSATSAIGYCLNLNTTPSKLLVRSGPWCNWLLSDTPSCIAAASNTTRILSFFWGWNTPWCGKYHVFPLRRAASSSVNFLA